MEHQYIWHYGWYGLCVCASMCVCACVRMRIHLSIMHHFVISRVHIVGRDQILHGHVRRM